MVNLTEKQWKHKVPADIAKEYHKAIENEDGTLYAIADAVRKVLDWMESIGIEDYDIESIRDEIEIIDLSDAEALFAEPDDEDDDWYDEETNEDYFNSNVISPMYDLLDYHCIWMPLDFELEEAVFGGYKYRYEVRRISSNGKDVLLGGANDIDNAIKIAKNQVTQDLDNPYIKDKPLVLGSTYILDSETDEEVETLELDKFLEDNMLIECLHESNEVTVRDETGVRQLSHAEKEIVDKIVEISNIVAEETNLDPRLIAADIVSDLRLINGTKSVSELESCPVNDMTKVLYDMFQQQYDSDGDIMAIRFLLQLTPEMVRDRLRFARNRVGGREFNQLNGRQRFIECIHEWQESYRKVCESTELLKGITESINKLKNNTQDKEILETLQDFDEAVDYISTRL